jgi:hypothetical protein
MVFETMCLETSLRCLSHILQLHDLEAPLGQPGGGSTAQSDNSAKAGVSAYPQHVTMRLEGSQSCCRYAKIDWLLKPLPRSKDPSVRTIAHISSHSSQSQGSGTRHLVERGVERFTTRYIRSVLTWPGFNHRGINYTVGRLTRVSDCKYVPISDACRGACRIGKETLTSFSIVISICEYESVTCVSQGTKGLRAVRGLFAVISQPVLKERKERLRY